MRIERLITGATQLVQRAGTRIREELGTPEERRAAVERVKAAARELLPEAGGQEYDENGDTIFPPGATIIADPDRDHRFRNKETP